jgi:cbb3-type cytochrome oxidase maturation protein
MSMLPLLITLALVLNVAALCAFMEAVDGGQFDTRTRTVSADPALKSRMAGPGAQNVNGTDPGAKHTAPAEELELWRSRCC